MVGAITFLRAWRDLSVSPNCPRDISKFDADDNEITELVRTVMKESQKEEVKEWSRLLAARKEKQP